MDPKVMGWLAAPVLLALAGCATMPMQTGSLCPVGPLIFDPGASSRWTRAEKEYAVTLNEAGEKICGWSPPSKGN